MLSFLNGLRELSALSVALRMLLAVICGGLIKDREDTMNALKSGASAISTTSENVWFM